MTSLAVPTHIHSWRIAEIEYGDVGAVRRYECDCGATNFEYVA